MLFGNQDHFFSLVDALSAIRVLTQLPVEEVSESVFLRQALDALVAHQNLGQCSIFLSDGTHLNCAVGAGADTFGDDSFRQPERLNSMQFTVDEGIMGLAVQTGQIQYCRNCKLDPRFKPFERRALSHGDGSLISMPIASGAEVLGVLNVSHYQPEFFETWQQHFLMLFATTLGRLLHLHRMTHQLGDEVAVRTHALAAALDESEKLRNRYQQLSIKDELTGLFNRRYFFTEGESMLSRAIRYKADLSLLLIDVDHFKRINDTWGHAVGDQVLRQISNIFLEEARAGDLVARLGGEEFVLALPNTAGEGLEQMASRIRQRIAASGFTVGDQKTELTVSIGITSLNGRDSSELLPLLERLYHEADCAMYQCKLDGRNRLLYYSPEMESVERNGGLN
ncbi:MAG: sensor domain-containing diguanylate cyclase [Sedimenticola sp.]|nr:sensor domain-containing diguanylate cyclase [Sedimenticola sp.]